MAYLVLARKYRPVSFADLVGQDHIVRTLHNAIEQNRVHHAFVFTGARGVGKTTTARVLARALNCEKGPTLTPCGACGPCRETLAGVSPDVLEIDGASNTGVDSVRELRETVRYMPAHSRFKIYVIDEVHMLSTAAFNALLKTLEEPPAHVKFIFATTEPHKIPITILSRCQRFDFRRVGLSILCKHLARIAEAEKVTIGPGALQAIAREAQGSVRDALSLLDQALSYAGEAPDDAQVLEALGVVDRQTVFALCDALLGRDAAGVLRIVGDIDNRGHDLSQLAQLIAEHLRDAAVIKATQDAAGEFLDRSQGEIEALKVQVASCAQDDLQRLFRQMLTVAEDVSRSIMPRISLEMGLLRLLQLAPGVDITTLLCRIDQLLQSGGQSPLPSTPGGGGAFLHNHPAAGGGSALGGGPKLAQSPKAPKAFVAPPSPSSAVPVAPAPAAVPAPVAAPVSAPAAVQAPVAAPVSAAAAVPVAAPVSAQAAQPPAAVSAPDAAPDPAQDATHLTAWKRFVDKMRGIRPALASVLEHGSVLAFGPMGVTVAYEPDTFYWNSARDPDNAVQLAQALEDHMGQKVTLSVVARKADMVATATLAQAMAEQREQYDQGMKQGAREHASVRAAVSILSGEVKEVRPLAAPAQE